MTIDIEKLKSLFENITGRKDRETKLNWKLETCNSGEDCWCRVIDLEGKEKGDEEFVASSGCLPKDDAMFMVEVVNCFSEILKVLEKENENA